jgi:hypothetical protein
MFANAIASSYFYRVVKKNWLRRGRRSLREKLHRARRHNPGDSNAEKPPPRCDVSHREKSFY